MMMRFAFGVLWCAFGVLSGNADKGLRQRQAVSLDVVFLYRSSTESQLYSTTSNHIQRFQQYHIYRIERKLAKLFPGSRFGIVTHGNDENRPADGGSCYHFLAPLSTTVYRAPDKQKIPTKTHPMPVQGSIFPALCIGSQDTRIGWDRVASQQHSTTAMKWIVLVTDGLDIGSLKREDVQMKMGNQEKTGNCTMDSSTLQQACDMLRAQQIHLLITVPAANKKEWQENLTTMNISATVLEVGDDMSTTAIIKSIKAESGWVARRLTSTQESKSFNENTRPTNGHFTEIFDESCTEESSQSCSDEQQTESCETKEETTCTTADDSEQSCSKESDTCSTDDNEFTSCSKETTCSEVATSTVQTGGSGEGSSTRPGGESGEESSTRPGSGSGEGSSTLPGDGSGEGSSTLPGDGSGEGSSTRPGGGSGEGSSTRPGGGSGEGSSTRPGGGSGEGSSTRPGSGSGEGSSTRPGGGSGEGSSTRPGGGSGEGSSTLSDTATTERTVSSSTDASVSSSFVTQPSPWPTPPQTPTPAPPMCCSPGTVIQCSCSCGCVAS